MNLEPIKFTLDLNKFPLNLKLVNKILQLINWKQSETHDLLWKLKRHLLAAQQKVTACYVNHKFRDTSTLSGKI